jgi:hypothetical protein
MRPFGRHRFQLAHDVGKTMRGTQSQQQMHMVGHTTDGLRDATEVVYETTEKGVQTRTPRYLDHRLAHDPLCRAGGSLPRR